MSIRTPNYKTVLLVLSMFPIVTQSVGAKEAAADSGVKRPAAAPAPVRKPAVRKSGPSATASEIKRGKALYGAYDCAACHKIAGKGCSEGVPLDGVGRRRSVKFLTDHLKDPEEHVSRNKQAFGGDPTNLMPPANLDRHELGLVVKYLQTLR